MANKSVEVKKIIKPKTNSVSIRKTASDTSQRIGFLGKNEEALATILDDGYYYIPDKKGWVKETRVTVVQNNKPSQSKKSTKEDQEKNKKKSDKKKEEEKKYTQREINEIYLDYINNEFGERISTDETSDKLLVSNLSGIYGIPYQFTGMTDPRLAGTEFGSIYADRIISRMPLLMMSPGKVSFMSDYTKGEGLSTLEALVQSSDTDVSKLNTLLSKPGRYYTFQYDNENYWKYVNTMNMTCAAYLGIDDVVININGIEAKIKNFKWEEASNSKFDGLILSSQNYICFYADAETSKNESFGNTTQESQLVSKVNSASDLAKEVQFIVGSQTGSAPGWLDVEQINHAIESINDFSDKWLNGNQLIKDLGKEFSVIATGGKLVFPEIWSDSTFSQTFDVKMKLRCPNPNKVSWFLDICVPINHLLAFTMPRTPKGSNYADVDFSKEPSANGYMTPFLVRAFYRGLFNCDMGIITDLNLSKGKEGSWTLDGLPTEVDVDFTIKDLYNVMFMTATDQPSVFLNNSTFLNYLANNCGISINKPDFERSMNIWMMIYTDYWKNKLSGYNFWKKAEQGIQNKLYDMYTGIFKG